MERCPPKARAQKPLLNVLGIPLLDALCRSHAHTRAHVCCHARARALGHEHMLLRTKCHRKETVLCGGQTVCLLLGSTLHPGNCKKVVCWYRTVGTCRQTRSPKALLLHAGRRLFVMGAARSACFSPGPATHCISCIKGGLGCVYSPNTHGTASFVARTRIWIGSDRMCVCVCVCVCVRACVCLYNNGRDACVKCRGGSSMELMSSVHGLCMVYCFSAVGCRRAT